MFWGKNLKSNETYSLDSDKTMLDSVLNITNISLSDALDNTKYYIKIQDNNQVFQVCSLDKTKDSITSSLTFQIKKGMKISVKGGNRGTISFVGFLENFPNEDLEEINTDKEKETKVIKKQEKKEVTPEINRGAIKEIDTGKEIKENKEKKNKEVDLEEDEEEESEEKNNKLEKKLDDDDDSDADEKMIEDDEFEEQEEDEDEEDNDIKLDEDDDDEEKEEKEEKEKKEEKEEKVDEDDINKLLAKKRPHPDDEKKDKEKKPIQNNGEKNKKCKHSSIKGKEELFRK